ncbi:DUF2621 family protein [Paenibacillus albiflavus]|uniref:DUF2621 family protein n=1 Tax=Paenibacillus albiflavus TaxID=2545760 RepID=A0A4V2WMZ9_9BACL|nr:DUF2621 family protein [Paenibacillus albiflavus]TCZ73572.1 DUF2621 family protein [Paenibacillus albiflavus]
MVPEFSVGVGWMTVFWGFVLLFFMSIGGFFMFRKFLKVLPKADGKSKLDWQNHYVEASRHLWTDESKAMLDKLVSPVPNAFRDIARHSIAAKIGQVALEDQATSVTTAHCIRGYILATPKRDHNFLMKFLDKEGIDYGEFKEYLQAAK